MQWRSCFRVVTLTLVVLQRPHLQLAADDGDAAVHISCVTSSVAFQELARCQDIRVCEEHDRGARCHDACVASRSATAKGSGDIANATALASGHIAKVFRRA